MDFCWFVCVSKIILKSVVHAQRGFIKFSVCALGMYYFCIDNRVDLFPFIADVFIINEEL